MSSYSKLIIFIAVLILVSLAIVMIDSSIDNINKSMPEISESIVQADKEYNESVDLLNDKNYEEARVKAISAGDNYNNSLKQLQVIRDKFDNDLNDVHKEYMDATITELELKIKAVDELKQAIDYLQDYYNYTGSSHATEANDLIYSSLEYQQQRNQIVQENPELFI